MKSRKSSLNTAMAGSFLIPMSSLPSLPDWSPYSHLRGEELEQEVEYPYKRVIRVRLYEI